MGARTSIAFKNQDQKSVVLFSHWGGMEFVEKAQNYVKDLNKYKAIKVLSPSTPLSRLEPNTVMIDFIRYATKNMTRVEGDLYLGKDQSDGDNSNFGHHDIEL